MVSNFIHFMSFFFNIFPHFLIGFLSVPRRDMLLVCLTLPLVFSGDTAERTNAEKQYSVF